MRRDESPLASEESVHVRAAVDVDRLAGDEIAVVGSEKDDGADEVIRFLVALEGASLSTVLKLLGCQHAFLLRTGDRESRRDRVHADIIGPQFAREGAGEADHARLRSHVVEKEQRAAERRA